MSVNQDKKKWNLPIQFMDNTRTVVCFFVLLLIAIPGDAKERKNSLTWAVIEFPPLTYRGTDQEFDGKLTLEIVAAFSQLNISVDLIEMPTRRHRNMQRYDFFVLPKHTSRDDSELIMSKAAIDTISTAVFWSNNTKPVVNRSDLLNSLIICISSYTYNGLLDCRSERYKQITNVENHSRGIQALIKGRGDYFIGYLRPALEVIKQQNITDVSYTVLESVPLHMFLRADYPNAHNILRQLERLLISDPANWYMPHMLPDGHSFLRNQ